jgi:hypothetical protein
MFAKKLTIIIFFLASSQLMYAQGKFFTKSGHISFISNAPLEDIEGKNKSVIAVLDSKTGGLQFSAIIRGFEFQKSLMQEHFNENYMESNKFPKADFKGTITNNSSIDYSKPGSYKATVKGTLSIHGITRDVNTNGIIDVDTNGIHATSSFTVTLADYKISIPSVVKDKISKTVKVVVDTQLDQVGK